MTYPGKSHYGIKKVKVGNPSTNYRLNIESSNDSSVSNTYSAILANSSIFDSGKNPADLQTDSNTVCYLKFLEGSGASINDQTVSNNDGTIINSGFSWNGSGAYSIDSSYLNLTVTNSGRVEIADNATLDFTNKMTLRVMFKINTLVAINTIAGKWHTTSNQGSWLLNFINSTKLFQFYIASPTSGQHRIFTIPYSTLQTGTWYLLQVNADLSGTEEVVDFTINGIHIPTSTAHTYTTSALTSFINSTQPVVINAEGSTYTNYSNISYARFALDNVSRSVAFAIQDAENLGFLPKTEQIKHNNDNAPLILNLNTIDDSDNTLFLARDGKHNNYKSYIGTANNIPLIFATSGVPRWQIDSDGMNTFYTPFIISKIFDGATPSGTGAFTGTRNQALIQNNIGDGDYTSLDYKLRDSCASWIWDYSNSYQGNIILRMSDSVSSSFEAFKALSDKNMIFSERWNFSTSNGHIAPTISDTFDIGSDTLKSRNFYAAGEFFNSGGKFFHSLGDESVSFGVQAFNSATNHTYSVAIGYQALFSQTNLNQGYNVAIGHKALYSQNVANGVNTAIGYRAMYNYTTGINNVAVGVGALEYGSGAGSNNNTAIGYYALRNVSATGGGLVAIGSFAGTGNTSGNQNTYLGYKSGDGDIRAITGSRNTLIGAGTHIGNSTYNDCIALGKDVITSATIQAVFGGNNFTNLFSNRWEIDSSGHFLPTYPSITGTPDTSSNLVAYYQFEGNGNDSSGNGNTGTVLGSASVASNYLNIGNDATSRFRVPESVLNSKSNWTISCWLDIDTAHTTASGFNATVNNTILTGFTTGVSSPLTITYFPNATYERVWRITFFNKNYYFGTHIPANLTAFHFALKKSGTTLSLYENGILLASHEIPDSQFAFSTNGLVIGQRQTTLDGGFSSTSSWAGKIDELRFYSRALSDIDIKTLSTTLGTIGVSISDPSYNIGGTSNRVNNYYGVNSDLSGTHLVTGLSTFNGITKFGSGIKYKFTTPGAYPYTVLTSDMVIRVDTSTARTINLFTATGNADSIICVKDSNGSASTNPITVDANGTQTIDNNLTDTINTNYGYQWYYCNGTNWEKIKGI